jgi:hypothetical protein
MLPTTVIKLVLTDCEIQGEIYHINISRGKQDVDYIVLLGDYMGFCTQSHFNISRVSPSPAQIIQRFYVLSLVFGCVLRNHLR